MTASNLRPRIIRMVFVAAFAFVSLALMGGGYRYYQTQAAFIRQSKCESIAAVAKMKVGQIVQWRKERISDVRRAANGPVFKRDFLEVTRSTASPEIREDLRKMTEMARQEGYANVLLVSADGTLLLSARENSHPPIAPATQQTVAAALASPEPVMSDFFRDTVGHVHIDTVAAVRDADGKGIGAVILRSNAEDYLFPLIQSWPIPTQSAETLLVRRDGGELLFLNELRHRSKTALFLRQPLTQGDRPGVQAVLGRRGIFEGMDYRNVPVLADLSEIPGTPWFMVAKVDQSEIAAEARYRAASTCVVVGALILLTGSVTASIYAHRQAGLLKGLLEAERQQKESRELFRATLYSIGDGVLTADILGCVREMNPVAEWLTGWTEAEARGLPMDEVFVIVNQGTRIPEPNPVTTVLREGGVVCLASHTILIARDGSEHVIANSAAPIRDARGAISVVVLVFNDITEEYRMREALSRREQQYSMLFEGMIEGFALHEIICDAGSQPVDYRFLSINPAFERMTGLSAVDIVGRTVREVMPQTESVWIERYGRVALTGEPIHFEQYARALGRHFSVTAFRPQPNQFAVLFEDISHREEMEKQLRLRESHLSAITENLPGMIWLKDDAGRFLTVNKTFASSCSGRTPEEMIGLTDADIWSDCLGNDHEVVSSGKPQIFEQEIFDHGQRLWYEIYKAPVRDEQGRVIGVAGYARNVTERHESEVRIARLSELYAALSQCNQGIVHSASAEELFPKVCRDVVSFGGMKMAWIALHDEASGRVCSAAAFGNGTEYLEEIEISTNEDAPSGCGPTGTAIREGQPVWCQDYKSDPSTAPWHERAASYGWEASASLPLSPGGRTIGALTIYSDKVGVFDEEVRKLLMEMADDISFALESFARESERKRTQEALQQSRNMLAHILDSVPQSVFWKDRHGVYLGCNKAFARAVGYANPEEVVGKTDFDFPWPKQDAEAYRADDREVMENNRPKLHYLEQEQGRAGVRLWVNTTKVPLTDSSGHVYGVLGFSEDVTERKYVEMRLQLQSAALEAAANAMVIADKQGVIEWVNTAFTTLSGYSAEEAIGQTPRLLNSGKHGADYFQNLWNTILAGNVWQGEIVNRRKNGSLYSEDMTITPIKDGSGTLTHFIAVKQDITERKQMEENLLRTQRMESIGTLASGVAHDLNNILTPIILSAEMLRGAETPETREGFIATIEECAQRGAQVVNQVLTFARGAKGEREPLHLECLVGEIERMMHETFPRNITIESALPKGLWTVDGDTTQIHQVLLNLCINARDAMPGGGSLRIAVENVEIDDHFAAMSVNATAGDYVMLAITDSGVGISRENISKIFDPFFTTKEVGKGTGLGLSIVIGIVRSHGGFVAVESKVGQGSTFKLFLPAARTGSGERSHQAFEQLPQGRGATLLLVDDETPITKVTAVVLEKNGYKVLTAADGAQGLELYKKHAKEIQLVLTDVMMPVMDGVDFATALKKINPQVKIIASTGQTTENRQTELQAMGVQTILIKPFDARKLLTVLHTAIHAVNA